MEGSGFSSQRAADATVMTNRRNSLVHLAAEEKEIRNLDRANWIGGGVPPLDD